ncbi:MAG TPA: NAD(P)/FAD-dependent oxidoreductase, partial [Chromatiales bacterium]|nr:NAD(P)/FAD-dependent oxidoreductase [Chromatiales bacterium]
MKSLNLWHGFCSFPARDRACATSAPDETRGEKEQDMADFNRRNFLKVSGIGMTAAMGGISAGQAQAAEHKAPMAGVARKIPLPKAKGQRVVIIGGGVSGLTIARYLKNQDVDFDVVLLERNALYQFCPISNLYMVGGMDLGYFTRSYLDAARNGDYTYVQATAYDADLDSQVVYTDQGHVAYDYLVVAPGIDYNYGSIGVEDPVDEYKLRQRYPAGFVPGSEHLTLRHKLQNFKGGVFVNTTPPGNYRCLPAPYERTCLIADYMKKNKLKGKVIHLDANPDITIKKKGFHAAFEELYSDYVEYIPSFEFNGVDVENKVVHSTFDKVEFDDASIY